MGLESPALLESHPETGVCHPSVESTSSLLAQTPSTSPWDDLEIKFLNQYHSWIKKMGSSQQVKSSMDHQDPCQLRQSLDQFSQKILPKLSSLLIQNHLFEICLNRLANSCQVTWSFRIPSPHSTREVLTHGSQIPSCLGNQHSRGTQWPRGGHILISVHFSISGEDSLS